MVGGLSMGRRKKLCGARVLSGGSLKLYNGLGFSRGSWLESTIVGNLSLRQPAVNCLRGSGSYYGCLETLEFVLGDRSVSSQLGQLLQLFDRVD